MLQTTLGEIAEWGSGGTPRRSVPEYFGSGIPWLSIADLNDGVVTEAAEELTEAGIANSAAKVVPEGTIFIAMYGSIGKLGIAGRDFCTSQAIAFAKPKPEIVDAGFLFHFLLSEREKLRARGRGGTQKNISQRDLKSWPIILPDLDEQVRISQVLDRAAGLRLRLQKITDYYTELTQGIFQEMFGSSSLRRVELGSVSEISSGITKGRRTSKATITTPYLAVSNVQAGYLDLDAVKTIDATEDEIARYTLADGDVVLTEGGDPDKLGRGTVWRNELPVCIHQNHIFRVRPSGKILPEYLSAYLASPFARSYFLRSAKQTTGIASINITQLRATPVLVPPLSDQQRFVSRVQQVEAAIGSVKRQQRVVQELFKSLQYRAFRGELRASVKAPSFL